MIHEQKHQELHTSERTIVPRTVIFKMEQCVIDRIYFFSGTPQQWQMSTSLILKLRLGRYVALGAWGYIYIWIFWFAIFWENVPLVKVKPLS